jgi:hypothetical protein
MARRLITVNDILAGHASLDVAWLDRIYLNGYLPTVGMALRSLGRIAGGPDQLGVAVSGTRTARGGKAVSERGGPDAGAGRRLDPETVSGAESWNVPTICWRWSSMATRS